MKLTKIEQQRNNPKRYSLYIDGQFYMGVDESVVIKFGLLNPRPIDQQQLDEIKQVEFEQSLYLKGIHYLSYGLRTTKEMRDYLTKYLKEHVDEEALDLSLVEDTIDRLTTQRYLDDLEYAKSYVQNHALINAKGPGRIRRELERKGVSSSHIEEGLHNYDEEMLLDNAKKISEKYIRTKKQHSVTMLKQKLMQYLMQRGYSRETIDQIWDQLSFQEAKERQDDLLDREGLKALRRQKRKHSGYELQQRIIANLMRKGFNYADIKEWMDNQEEGWDE